MFLCLPPCSWFFFGSRRQVGFTLWRQWRNQVDIEPRHAVSPRLLLPLEAKCSPRGRSEKVGHLSFQPTGRCTGKAEDGASGCNSALEALPPAAFLESLPGSCWPHSPRFPGCWAWWDMETAITRSADASSWPRKQAEDA